MVEIRIGIPAVFIHQLDCFSIVVFWFFCKSSQKNDKVTYTMMTIGLDGKQESNKETDVNK